MPNLASRFDHESQIASALSAPFAAARDQAIKSPKSVDWTALQKESEKKLSETIFLIYLLAIGGMEQYTDDFHPDETTSKKLAKKYAETKARETTTTMVDNMRKELDSAYNQAVRDVSTNTATLDNSRLAYENRVKKIFDDERAKNIGITETTDAITEAEQVAAEIHNKQAEAENKKNEDEAKKDKKAKRDGQPGGDGAVLLPKVNLILVGYWVTQNDEHVCKICDPLNEKRLLDLQKPFSDGPAAHPRCRCYIHWRKELPSASNS